jgi:hypothetical protein
VLTEVLAVREFKFLVAVPAASRRSGSNSGWRTFIWANISYLKLVVAS